MSRPASAVGLTLAWGIVLALLAGAWIQSPFTGPGPMFGLWTAVALPLGVWTLSRARAWGLGGLPGGPTALVAILVLWALAGWAATSALPAEWAIDGLILRDDWMRRGGTALAWFPGVFGLTLSVAGLAGGLEARHRLARAAD